MIFVGSISKQAAKELVRRVKKCDEIDLDSVVHKVLGDNKRHYLNIGIKAIEDEMSELNGIKDCAIKERGSYDTISVPESEDYDKAVEKAFKNKKNVSLGSIGKKVLRIRRKYYVVKYPIFKVKGMAEKIKFLEKLVKRLTVPNSMFCFAGSAEIYRNAIKNL